MEQNACSWQRMESDKLTILTDVQVVVDHALPTVHPHFVASS